MKKEYLVSCETEENIDLIIKQLITPGIAPENTTLFDHIHITNYLPGVPNTVLIELTNEEKENLEKNPIITNIGDNIKEPASPHVVTRILNPAYSGVVYTQDDNWGFARCNSISAMPPWDNTFTQYKTGSGVDVLIIDSGVYYNHKEFKDDKGVSRINKINWSFYFPITANNDIPVTFSNNNFNINGVPDDTVYVVSDKPNGSWYDVYRTEIYRFNLDGVTTLNDPFYIGPSIGNPFNATYVSNNGATTGTVTLSVYGGDRTQYTTSQKTMYYWSGRDSAINGIITRTKYNTQSDDPVFYDDTNGHGTHTTGTVAGSAYGWAPDANIYSIHLNFTTDVNGYDANSTGLIEVYSLVTNWHNEKKSGPNFRPTVTNNSYGWPYTIPEVNLAVRNMINSGVHFVHSAGNSSAFITVPTDPTFNSLRRCNNNSTQISQECSPAYPTDAWTNQNNNPVICVGALGDYDNSRPNTRAIYSNYGPGVSLYAPGTWIISANYTVGGALYPGGIDYVIKKSGTSMAAPQVAGILATMLQDMPNLTPMEAKNLLLQNCLVGAISGHDGLYVYSGNYYNNTRLYSLSGGANLTITKYPAKYFVTTPNRTDSYARYLGYCYRRTDTVQLSNFTYNTLFFMNSSEDMAFGSSCP